MVALDIRQPFEAAVAIAEESGYTRFPLVDGDLDRVVGMVHFRDLIGLAHGAGPKELGSLRREVLFVPEGRPAEALLADLLSRGRHMAIVLDEFGATAGLVTLEDVLEEMFGEIRDEFDIAEAERPYRRLGEGHFLLDAQIPLHEANDLLGTDLAEPGASTLAGWIVAKAGRLPAKGERLEVGPYKAIVREADRKRVKLVELWRPSPPAEPGEEGAAEAPVGSPPGEA